eukprot:PhF_6_TR5157/c1_g1_i2/m.7378
MVKPFVVWCLYILFGVVVPFLVLAVTITPTGSNSVVTIANVSILGLCIILHNEMFSIISPNLSDAPAMHRLIRNVMPMTLVGMMCAFLYGMPRYTVGPRPTAPNLDTGECKPFVSVLSECTSFHYYKTIEVDAVSQFNGTIYSDEVRDMALINGIYQVAYLYGYFLAGVNTSTDLIDAYMKVCPPLWRRYACAS